MRPADAADAAGILDCLRAAFAPYESQYTPAAFHDTVLDPGTVQTRLAETCVFVAAGPDGDIVGTVGYQMIGSDEAHIRGMAVLPAWQGRAVAQMLLDAALVDARARGCSRATLDTTAPLKRAVRFYERNGFRASGRVQDFFGMPLFEYVKPLA